MHPSDWDRFIGMLHPQAGEKILDIGAGNGEKAAKVIGASGGAELFAVDPNGKKIADAKRAHPEIKSSVAGAEKLPFDDSYFDKAYSTMAFHHFADIDLSLTEIARVLKHGGSYILLEVEPGSPLGRAFRFFGRLMGEHMTVMTRAKCVERLGAAKGLKVTESESLGSKYLIRPSRP